MLELARHCYRARDLILNLTLRYLHVRYRVAFLGVVWAFVPPLVMAWLFTAVVGRSALADTAPGHESSIPAGVYYYAGFVLWFFFSGALGAALDSIWSNRVLVANLPFPREALPVSAVLAKMPDLGIALAVLAGLLVYHRAPLAPALALVPVILASVVLLVTGLALLLSAVGAFFRDTRHLFDTGLLFLLLASGVFAPVLRSPAAWNDPALLNPLAAQIEAFRCVALVGRAPPSPVLASALVLSFLFFGLGVSVFARVSPRLSEVA